VKTSESSNFSFISFTLTGITDFVGVPTTSRKSYKPDGGMIMTSSLSSKIT